MINTQMLGTDLYLLYSWIDTITKYPVNIQNKHLFKNYRTLLVCLIRGNQSEDILLYKKKFIERACFPNTILTKQNLIKQ